MPTLPGDRIALWAGDEFVGYAYGFDAALHALRFLRVSPLQLSWRYG